MCAEISRQVTIDTIIAKLLDMLGISDNEKWTKEQKKLFIEEVNKMFSQISEQERETLLWYIDLYNTYEYPFLITYIFDFLKLGVSLNRKGREEIAEIGKMPFQMQNQNERSRLDKIRELFT